MHTKKKKITVFEHMERILCAVEVSPPTSIYWPSQKKWLSHKWLYPWHSRTMPGCLPDPDLTGRCRGFHPPSWNTFCGPGTGAQILI